MKSVVLACVLSAVVASIFPAPSAAEFSEQTLIDARGAASAMLQSNRLTQPKSRQEILDEQLKEAVRDGRVADIHRLAKLGANVNVQDGSGPLLGLAAAIFDGPEVAAALLQEGADVAAKGPCGGIALQDAAHNGHLATVQLLVAHHSPVDSQDCLGATPLFDAAAWGQAEVVSFLLKQARADPNLATTQGETALMRVLSIEEEDDTIVKLLLADPRTDVNRADPKGMTALKLAVQAKRADFVKLLLANPRIDVNNDAGGVTALFIARTVNRKDIVELLVRAGARD